MNYLILALVLAANLYLLVPTFRYWTDETLRLAALEVGATLRKELIRWGGILGLGVIGLLATPQGSDFVESMVERFDGDTIVAPVEMNAVSGGGVIGGVAGGIRERASVVIPPPPPSGGDLYTNEPAGFTTLHENTMQFVVEDSTDWTGNTWESRTDAVTFAGATCDGVGDDYTNRHNHPGDGTAQADYGGSFNWTPGVTMDSMYIALCLYVNGTITGGGSNHGIKLDFLRTEDAGGADHFPTWSSSNFFGMHWQSGFSEPDDNTAYSMGVGAEDSPVWFEYLYIASDNGVANGEAHVWIDGVKAYTNTTIDWSDSSSGNCTGSRCGFVGWQMYRNTDEGAGLVQHYLYTSHFYASYKGVAN